MWNTVKKYPHLFLYGLEVEGEVNECYGLREEIEIYKNNCS